MFVVESRCVLASVVGERFRKRSDFENDPERSNPKPRSTRCLLRPGEWFGERALMGAETTRAIEVTAGDGGEDEDEDERPASALGRRRNDDAVRASPVRAGVRARRELADRPAQRAPGVRRGRLAAAQPGRGTRSALADALRPVCVEPGGVVFEQGDEATENGDALYFVESGAIEISRDARVLTTATRRALRRARALNNEPRAAKATASNAGAFLLALSRGLRPRGGRGCRAPPRKAAEAACGTSRSGQNAFLSGQNAFLSGQNPLSAAPLSSGFNVFGADPRLADFELRAVLGVGAFGKVYLAKHRASARRAPSRA